MLENRSDQIAGTQGRTQDLELGGGGGGASGVSRIRKVGGASGPICEKWGRGGGGGASGPIYEKWGGGGGGHSASDTFGRTENIYMYLPTCYLGILHTRARMNTCRQRFCHPYAVRGACALNAPPLNPPLGTLPFVQHLRAGRCVDWCGTLQHLTPNKCHLHRN